ncbi:MAG: amidohydrolase [Candidatus Thorarchaeota archaeon]
MNELFLKGIIKFSKRKINSTIFPLILFVLLSFPIILRYIPVQNVSADNLVIVDYIFCNSNIITVDKDNPFEEAIAIKDGIIVALGPTEDILNEHTTENNTCYDLQGLTMMPGIIDGHTHLIDSSLSGSYETLDGAQAIALAFGYTTLNDKMADDWNSQIQPLLEAELNNELRLRVNIFPISNQGYLDENNETTIVERWYPDYDPILDHARMFRVPGIKIFLDGAAGNRGLPAMSVPYSQEALEENGWVGYSYGHLYFNQSTLNSIVKTIQDKGFSCAFHAMGDVAIETALNAIEWALDGETDDNYRHQIEHNSFIRSDLITQAINLNTVHSVRGYFPTYWQEEYEARMDEDKKEWYVNRYSLPDIGLHAYLETDFTWAVYNDDDLSNSRNIKPFLHMWGLVTRKAIAENGTIIEPHPWIAEHEISVEQAIRMMTLEGAYAVKQEDYIGSLEVGKYADLIILTANPLTIDEDEIKNINVQLTMVGGKIEYQWNSHTFPLPYSSNPTPNLSSSSFLTVLLLFYPLIFLLSNNMKKR